MVGQNKVGVDRDTTKPTKVLTAVGPENDNQKLTASQVRIEHVEMPEKLRAKTQFNNEQGSHTIAWTFLKTSLMEMFKNCTVDVFLQRLAKLIENDKNSLPESADENESTDEDKKAKDLSDQLKLLHQRMKEALDAASNPQHSEHQRTLGDWIIVVNELFKDYVKLNQLLPTTTFRGTGRPKGQGEPAANTVFEQTRKEKTIDDKVYKELLDYAPLYIDSGIFYRTYLDKINKYPSRKRSSPLRKSTEPSVTFPEELDPNNAPKVLQNLLDQNEQVLEKVFGDFYFYLEYFHPAFYQKFKSDADGKKKFFEDVLMKPIKIEDHTEADEENEQFYPPTNLPSDIAQSIWKELKRIDKDIKVKAFFNNLIEAIKSISSEWSQKLLTSEQPPSPMDTASDS